jgi:hypothetical protein
MMPIPLSTMRSTQRDSAISDAFRQRALERLYERWAVVDTLIQSLEDYQRSGRAKPAECIEITAAKKWSSGCVQSRI